MSPALTSAPETKPAADPAPRETRPSRVAPWRPWALQGGTWERPDGTIDSVQWVDLPGLPRLDLTWVERAYFRWVPRLSCDTVRPRWNGKRLSLALEPWHWPPLIRMNAPRETAELRERPILGGFLAEPHGILAFELLERPAGRRLVVAVRGLRPRLPRAIYLIVQRRLHERSTYAFLREIARGWRRSAE